MAHPIFAIAGATLLEAHRKRLPWALLAIGALALAACLFVRALALTESVQLQAALLGAGLRLATVALTASFVVASMLREVDDRADQLLLALPMPRAAYLLGKLLGFALTALAPALMAAVLAALFAPLSQALLWAASLLCELWIIVAFSLLCAVSMRQLLPALGASVLFYVLARSMSGLLALAHGTLTTWALKAIAFLLPDLGSFTRTEWLVYNTGGGADLAPVLAQSAIYVTLLTAAALFDLYRKPI